MLSKVSFRRVKPEEMQRPEDNEEWEMFALFAESDKSPTGHWVVTCPLLKETSSMKGNSRDVADYMALVVECGLQTLRALEAGTYPDPAPSE